MSTQISPDVAPLPGADGQAGNQPFLEFRQVGQVFSTQRGPFEALSQINLQVKQSEFVCVIGHSGCGKSTMLNMV
jgi:ABC-type nitrate/sulfonate/bicarbonate transport system ATPase subunit